MARTRTRRLPGARGEALTGYAFVLPQLVGSAAFVIGPLIAVFWYSLHDWNVLANKFTFVGGENYARMFDDPGFSDSLRVSAIFSVGLVVLNITLALALAVMLNQRMR